MEGRSLWPGIYRGLEIFQSWPRLFGYFGLSLIVWLGICFFYWIFLLAYEVKVPFS